MHIQAITVGNSYGGEGRRLDNWIEFAGGVAAIFWLASDAMAAAKAMSLETPDATYTVVSPGDVEMGGETRTSYVNGEVA